MKLGGSLERRRGRRRPPPPGGEDGSGFRTLDLTGKVALTVAGVVVLGWLVGYVVATQVLFPAPPPPGDLDPVPDVRGIGVASARERLEGVGLKLGEIDSLLHPSVAEGIILGQSPLPGQLATEGTTVRVTMSRGPQMRAVPDVERSRCRSLPSAKPSWISIMIRSMGISNVNRLLAVWSCRRRR